MVPVCLYTFYSVNCKKPKKFHRIIYCNGTRYQNYWNSLELLNRYFSDHLDALKIINYDNSKMGISCNIFLGNETRLGNKERDQGLVYISEKVNFSSLEEYVFEIKNNTQKTSCITTLQYIKVVKYKWSFAYFEPHCIICNVNKSEIKMMLRAKIYLKFSEHTLDQNKLQTKSRKSKLMNF